LPRKPATQPSKKPKIDADQQRRFIEAARELGCDEDTTAADALMGRLARTPPKPQPKRKQGTKKP